MATDKQLGWSPNPIYNQGPVHQAAAPTPLGQQAHALMNTTPVIPSQHMRTPATAMMSPLTPGVSYMSPGPSQSLLNPPPHGASGRFQHYVPSVRYIPPTEVEYEDEDDFVLVEEKQYRPRSRRPGRRRAQSEPWGFFKGIQNIFQRQKPPPLTMETLPPGFMPHWPTATAPTHPSVANQSPTVDEKYLVQSPAAGDPTALPYSQAPFSPRSQSEWVSQQPTPMFSAMSPRAIYSPVADPAVVFNAYRPPDPRMVTVPIIRPPLPKPPEWSTRNMARPSWECQLNPLLVHHLSGSPVIHFDLRLPTLAITVLPPPHVLGASPRPLSEADLAQHATWPACSQLTIAAVADEPLFGSATFPWPISVVATNEAQGVTCGDVWTALGKGVMQHVLPREYHALSSSRQNQVKLSYWARCSPQAPVEENGLPRPPEDDGCRRIDVLGTRVMFRGLEPAPGVDGSWVMFLGPP